MDVNTFDVSVNSAVLSGADNRKCAEYENVVAFIIITAANDESFFFIWNKKESLESKFRFDCGKEMCRIGIRHRSLFTVCGWTAISVFTNVTIHNRDEKGKNCQLLFRKTE